MINLMLKGRMAKLLRKNGINVKFLVDFGSPVQEIVSVVKNEKS